MKIEENQIAEKKIVGKTGGGDPVVMVLTHGGLYAFFYKKDKTVESLGMAPHKAIAAWMAEKKDPSITWKDDFMKSEETELEDLQKSQDSQFQRLRKAMFAPSVLTKSEPNDYYLIYDTTAVTIGIMHKVNIKEGLHSNSVDDHCLVRNLNLSESATLLRMHKDFK